MNPMKDLLTGLVSGMIRTSIAAGLALLITHHPAVAHVLAPLGNPILVDAIAIFLGNFLVSLAGALLRRARHNALFEEAYQAGIASVSQPAGAPPALPTGPKSGRAALSLLLLVCGLFVAGCGTFIINVNVLGNQTRMAQAQGTNTVRQAIEGGGSASSNALTATIPLH